MRYIPGGYVPCHGVSCCIMYNTYTSTAVVPSPHSLYVDYDQLVKFLTFPSPLKGSDLLVGRRTREQAKGEAIKTAVYYTAVQSTLTKTQCADKTDTDTTHHTNQQRGTDTAAVAHLACRRPTPPSLIKQQVRP